MRSVLRIITGEPIRSEPRTITQVRSSCRDKRLFMSSMRPDTARPSGVLARSAAKRRVAHFMVRSAIAIMAVSGLAACSGQDSLSLPLPPHPNVPAVTHDTYPTIGTADDTGRKILDPKARAALEQDIARTGAQHGRTIENRLQAESEFNTGTN